MATIYISSGLIDQGETVYFVLRRPSDGAVLDNDDDNWEANKAACVDYKWPAVEITDLGDATWSPYVLSINGDLLNAGATPVLIQAVAYYDLPTDVVAAYGEHWIESGEETERPTFSEVNTQADAALTDYDAVIPADLAAGLAGLNDLSAADIAAALAAYDTLTQAQLVAALAGLNDPTPAQIVAALMATAGITAVGAITFQGILQRLLSAVSLRIRRDGNTCHFYDDDGTTVLFSWTVSDTERTPA